MSRHVVIVGGGVVGLSTAWFARQRGWDVTVCDRNGPARDGCSFGNAGMIVPSHFTPLAAPGMVTMGLKWMLRNDSPFALRIRPSWGLAAWGWRFWRSCTRAHVRNAGPILRDLNLAGRECYSELAELWGDDIGLERRGILMLCRDRKTFDEEAHVAESARTLGIPTETLDGPAVAKLDPSLRADLAGAMRYPADATVNPGRFLGVLQQRLEAAGCKFVWNTSIDDFIPEAGRLRAVSFQRQTLDADAIVLAGGVDTPTLLDKLGFTLRMQAGKGYSMTRADVPNAPTQAALLIEARVAVTPWQNSVRVGGTMEIGGLADTVAPNRVRGILQSLPSYYHTLGADTFAGVQPWVGLRPCSPDGLPYLGRAAGWDNLYIAAGHGMMGLSLGPISGKLTAQLLDGETPAIDLTACSPNR